MTNRGGGVSGTCFRLELPLELPRALRAHGRNAAVAPDAAATAATGSGGPLGYRVLVVDDSAMNRRIAERLLRGMGCSCVLADDGDEVPAAVARERFDVILMDIRMIRLNGDTACAALRAAGYVGAVIAVTGNATLLDSDAHARVGFTSTLGKPFGTAELRAAMTGAIGAAAAAATARAIARA